MDSADAVRRGLAMLMHYNSTVAAAERDQRFARQTIPLMTHECNEISPNERSRREVCSMTVLLSATMEIIELAEYFKDTVVLCKVSSAFPTFLSLR